MVSSITTEQGPQKAISVATDKVNIKAAWLLLINTYPVSTLGICSPYNIALHDAKDLTALESACQNTIVMLKK